MLINLILVCLELLLEHANEWVTKVEVSGNLYIKCIKNLNASQIKILLKPMLEYYKE